MTPRRFAQLPRLTRVYIGVVTAVGSATIADSFVQLYVHNVPWPWSILALLTLVSGSATVILAMAAGRKAARSIDEYLRESH